MAITDISISCLQSKLKLKQNSWFYSHLGHCSLEGNLQAPHLESPPSICLLSTVSKPYPFIFYRHYTMAEYTFFLQKVERWRKDIASLWGNLNICPQLHQLQLPCHTQAELSSLNSLKVWGEVQKPCHDIAFLLVWVENAMGDRHYCISIVWANPSQVRAASMEEAVKKLTACTSSGTDWPYTLVWLHEGTCHVPLPKEGHLGVLPQRGVEEAPCGWISQLEVCQLLIAGSQVIYPIGLNGHEEPIITSLPELLASGVSLTAGEPIYLGIDIPSPPVEKPDQKIPALGEVSTIVVASPHKSSPKSEGSMTMEVSNLLS